MKRPSQPALIPVLLVLFGISSSYAAVYDWDGESSTNWSVTNNWLPDSTLGGPTMGDTANLGDTTTNRTIVYDSGASGSLNTLNFNQSTAGVTNTLLLLKSLTNTTAITLGASAGVEQIIIGSSSSTGYAFTPSGGLTLNSGGELVMTATGNGTTGVNFGNTGGTGLLTIGGGTLTIAATTGTTSATSAGNTLSMGLTMTSGALTIANTTGIADRRLLLQGAVNVSGGSITTTRSGGGGAIQFDTTNAITFNPTTFDTDITLTLGASAAQSLTTDKTLFVVQARGTGVKTLTSTAASNGIAQLQMFDANSATPSSRTTLKLGSNLTSTSGAGMPAAQSFGNTHESGRIDLGIDTAGFTLDLSAGASSGVWTPNASTQSGVTNTVWTLSGSGAIKANAFVFTNSGVTTDVSSGTTLIASGANSTVNNLGGTGTIDGNSVFRYAGTAATNTPATLTFNRNIGDLEVTAGALRLLSNAVGTVQDLRVSGGTLDLQGGTNAFATISLTGGTLANGTYQTSEANFTNLQTGTVSGSLVGTKKLIKNSAGTLTLSGFNNLNNNALEVLAGTVAITTASALNGVSSLDMKGGTLDLGGTTNNKFITLTNGSVIQNGTIARTSVTGWTLYDGTISANLTTSGSGAINITKAGSGTLILSGANSYVGSTLISAGRLQVGSGGTSGALGAGNVTNNASLAFNRSDNLAVTNTISGTGSLTKSGNGTLTLSGANTYNGGTTLSQGGLRLDSTNAAGSGTITQSNGSILEINTTGTVANAMSIFNIGTLQSVTLSGNKTLNNATYTVASGTTTTESGVLTGTGGITKEGAGTLVVTASNSFNGPTAVNAGVLELASASGGAVASTSSVSVGSGATLLVSQSNQVNNNAAVTLSGGTIGRASGVSEVFGNLSVTSGSFLDFGSGTAGTVNFGTYSQTGSSLLTVNNFFAGNVLTFTSDLTASLAVGTYSSASYTSADNLFTINSISGGFTTSYSGGTFTITAIPEPATMVAAWLLIAFAGWAVLRNRFPGIPPRDSDA